MNTSLCLWGPGIKRAKGTGLSAPEGFSGSGNRLKYGRWLGEEKTTQKEVPANPPGEAWEGMLATIDVP